MAYFMIWKRKKNKYWQSQRILYVRKQAVLILFSRLCGNVILCGSPNAGLYKTHLIFSVNWYVINKLVGGTSIRTSHLCSGSEANAWFSRGCHPVYANIFPPDLISSCVILIEARLRHVYPLSGPEVNMFILSQNPTSTCWVFVGARL